MTDIAQPSAVVGEPEGWVLVPREPTEGMLNGAAEALPRSARYAFGMVWSAMLTAAPSAPPSTDWFAGTEDSDGNPLPPSTDAAGEAYARVCEGEKVDAAATGDDGDAIYNRACDDCAAAIRSLATLSPSPVAAGGEGPCICGDSECRLWLEHGHAG